MADIIAPVFPTTPNNPWPWIGAGALASSFVKAYGSSRASASKWNNLAKFASLKTYLGDTSNSNYSSGRMGGRGGRVYSYRKRNFRRCKGKRCSGKIVKRSGAVNMRTAGMVGMELKYKNFTLAANYVSNMVSTSRESPATTTCFCGVSQGSGADERVGRTINIKSLELRGLLVRIGHSEVANLDGGGGCNIRLALVLDRQNNGSSGATGTDVWDAGTAMNWYGMRNLENRFRFKVLWERTFELAPTIAANDNQNTTICHNNRSKFVHLYKRLNIPVTFNGTGETITTINDNCLHLFAMTQAANQVQLSYDARIRFMG